MPLLRQPACQHDVESCVAENESRLEIDVFVRRRLLAKDEGHLNYLKV